jgi:hypothetical protein
LRSGHLRGVCGHSFLAPEIGGEPILSIRDHSLAVMARNKLTTPYDNWW